MRTTSSNRSSNRTKCQIYSIWTKSMYSLIYSPYNLQLNYQLWKYQNSQVHLRSELRFTTYIYMALVYNNKSLTDFHVWCLSTTIVIGAHSTYKCSKFLALTISDRINNISDLMLCKICLRAHEGEKCTSRRCPKCARQHNGLLHLPRVKIMITIRVQD